MCYAKLCAKSHLPDVKNLYLKKANMSSMDNTLRLIMPCWLVNILPHQILIFRSLQSNFNKE